MVYFDLFYLDWLSMVLALACPMSCANVLKILKFMISFFFFWQVNVLERNENQRENWVPQKS
jgi:hypothetical protein